MDRTLLGLVVGFAGALSVVGLTFSKSAEGPADFRFANGTEPKTLDPQMMAGEPEGRIADAVFEGLTRRDAATLRPVPGVAKSWDISLDGKRYTFHLREDAKWSDGRPLTAADFVYGWKRLEDPTLASEYAGLLAPVRYAEALNTFDGLADAIEHRLLPATLALSKERPTGLDARDWQIFLSKNRAHDALGRTADDALQGLLSKRTGTLAAAELRQFEAALAPALRTLRAQAAEARAHFGVDGGVFATDPHTLVVELRAPTPYFLQITCFYGTFPAPKWAIDGHEADWFLPERIVTNGPYRLTRWLVNDHIRFERSELYWGKDEVRLRSMDALSVDNETTALNLYLTHALDWIPEMYPKDLAGELRGRPDFYAQPGMIVYFYRLNTSRPPFDDVRVRRAVNLAVDRKLITEQVLGLGQIPATTFVPPGIPGYESPASTIRFDVDRARALLSEAGYPGGKGFPAIGILYNTNGQHKKIAEEIAGELRANLGIEARAYNQEWQSFLDTTRALSYDMARAGWIGDFVDPDTFLNMWVTNGGNNQTGFSSPLYDRLVRAAADVEAFAAAPESVLRELSHPEEVRAGIEEMRREADPLRRRAAQAKARLLVLRAAESLLIEEELPILPLFFYVSSGLVSPRTHGFHSKVELEDGSFGPNLQDLHPLRDLFVDGASP